MNTFQEWLAGSAWLKTGTAAFLLRFFLDFIWIVVMLVQLQTGSYYVEWFSFSMGTGSIALLFFVIVVIDILMVVLLFRISGLGKLWAVMYGAGGILILYLVLSGKSIEFPGFHFPAPLGGESIEFSDFHFPAPYMVSSPLQIFRDIIGVFGSLCIVIAKDFSNKRGEKIWQKKYIVSQSLDMKKMPDTDEETIISIENGEVILFLDQAYEETKTKTIWHKVSYQGMEGWCNYRNVEKYYD